MPETPTRADPKSIHTSLKEAVVDALLNVVHARVSAAGEFGQVLYGTRPRNLINSGFLLPMRRREEGDEVTSPIWISSHGLDFQVRKNAEGQLILKPHFSLYVRVLPTEADLTREDSRLTFRLKRDVAKRLSEKIRDALDAKWKEVKGAHKDRREHPDWLKIRADIQSRVRAEEGVPGDLSRVGVDEESSGEDDESEDRAPSSEGVAISPTITAKVRDEQFEPLSIPQKWLRLELDIPPLMYSLYADSASRADEITRHEVTMREAIQNQLASWIASEEPDAGGKLWAFRRNEEIRPSQYRDWKKYLADVRSHGNPPALPYIELKWDISESPDWLDKTRLNIHVALENRSKDPKQNVEETDPSVFQVSVVGILPASVHRDLKLERVEPSYRYNEYLTYPAMGFNGGVTRRNGAEGQVILETTWAPRYLQPRIIPTSYVGVERGIRKLVDPTSFDNLRPIVPHLRKWLDDLPKLIDRKSGLDPEDKEAIAREELQFTTDCKKWAMEIQAIEAGLEMLEESKRHWLARGIQPDERAIPFEAWLAMNEAMADLMRTRLKDDSAQWHLFQLAFVLANLTSVATRLDAFKNEFREERDDAVTLLYFPTGGGKSEAFFGLLVFTLFFDRLRNKRFGLSAMIRYPLRLLTIQQAQRASRVLACAERVRTRYQYGGLSFSIGFWVGSGGSPNWLSSKGVSDIPTISARSAEIKEEERLRLDDVRYSAAYRAWNKIPTCPFCESVTALRRFPSEGGTLGHVCTDRNCDSNGGSYKPLPFFICDEDIYDFAPSVVLGTVDKLALIGHYPTTIRRVLGMFGAAPWRRKSNGRLCVPSADDLRAGPDARACERLKPAYADGADVFKDPFPALLIQDEAHLLDESLGAFAGLFESTLDAVFAELFESLKDIATSDPLGKRRRPKVIAASATVAEPDRQLNHLYQRQSSAVQFPYPGPKLYESFYAHPEDPDPLETQRTVLSNIEVRSRQARIYAGFMTNGRPHTATSVAVLAAFHLSISDLFTAIVDGDGDALETARDRLIRNLSDGPLRDVHESRLRAASASELATLLDLHRIALTYVTNKKGGDQIMAAEAEETRKLHARNKIPFDHLTTSLITGSVDQGDIQKVVQVAQDRPNPGEKFRPLETELRSVIATSAVSHGVDIEEFNSMFFAGMPSDVAEYIQASSRVGRTHIGFCVLIPTPQRRRDRFIIEVFDIYHRFLERMVQPAAIDRWAERAVERVLPSLFQTFVCGVTPSREIIETRENDKSRVSIKESISEILRQYRAGEEVFFKNVLGFISRALGLDGEFAPDGSAFYRARVDRRIRDLITRIAERDWEGAPLSTFFKNQNDPMWRPMTSLRDVDQAGLIRVAARDSDRHYQEPGTVKSIMDLIRHGIAESDDGVDDEFGR
jgi:hypothetical protein